MSNLVYVLNCDGKPLMPCRPQKARKLLSSGKARCVSRTPFVIKLHNRSADQVQIIVAGMDTGSKTIGTAAINTEKDCQVVYQAEATLRGQEIKRKMEQRAMYRRTRRARLRYRKPRFSNRRASTKIDRLPPSIRHKVESHLKERKFVESILPVSKWFVETASFDIHKISNPSVNKKNGWTYQKGQKHGMRKLGYCNTKQFILFRDEYTCQKCKKRKEGLNLHVHHIIFKSNGGTDAPNNLVTLCKTCHNKIHSRKNAEKESLKLQKDAQKHTKHATEVSVLRSQLLKSDWDFEETFGYVTKFNRENSELPKTHANDAIIIALQGEPSSNPLRFNGTVLIRRYISKGDYQQTKGPHSNKAIPTGKLFGLRKFDLVETSEGVGFVKGKRSSGFFAISDIFGNAISNSVNIKKNCTRKTARGSLIMETQFLPALKNGVSLRKLR